MPAPIGMKAFALGQINALADSLTAALHTAAGQMDMEAVHQVRVAIRRFTQALKIFAQYIPESGAKKSRKQLRRIMQLSSIARDLDIAVEFLEKHRQPSSGLEERRVQAREALAVAIHAAIRSGKWRSKLALEAK